MVNLRCPMCEGDATQTFVEVPIPVLLRSGVTKETSAKCPVLSCNCGFRWTDYRAEPIMDEAARKLREREED